MPLQRTTLLTLLSLLLAGAAWAQTPLGPEFQVNTFTTGDQRYAAVAADALGNFVVVWATDGQDGSAGGIVGRRFDAAGNPRGGEFQVNTYITGNQLFPAVASDPAGNFVVVWESSAQDGDSVGVFGRVFDAAGIATTAEFPVNTHTINVQAEPQVVMNGSGFVVVWESYLQGGTPSSIFGQRFDAAGARLGTEFQVETYTGSQYRPGIGQDAAGNFVVVWESFGQEGPPSSYGVYAQRFDPAGQPVGGEFRVNSVTLGSQRNATVAADRGGAFTVSWSGPDADGAGIWAQRYNAAGAPLGVEFPINTFTTGAQTFPVAVADANANVIVTWGTNGQDGSGLGIAANRFGCAGQGLGTDFLVNTTTSGDQREPLIAASSGDFVVIWTSAGQDGGGQGVFGRRFRGLPSCGRFYTVTPCRLADTRQATGPTGGPPLAANAARDFPVGGACGIPVDARAVAFNITTTNQTEVGNLRLYPAGEPLPLSSSSNFVANHPRANNAIVGLGANGQLSVRCDMAPGSTGRTDFILDAYGYFR